MSKTRADAGETGPDGDLLGLARRAVGTLDASLADVLALRLRRIDPDHSTVAAAREQLRAAYFAAIQLRARRFCAFVRSESPSFEFAIDALENEIVDLFRVDPQTARDAPYCTLITDNGKLHEVMVTVCTLWTRHHTSDFIESSTSMREHARRRLTTITDYLAFFIARADLESQFLTLAGARSLLEALGPGEVERVTAMRQGLARAKAEDLWRLSSPL